MVAAAWGRTRSRSNSRATGTRACGRPAGGSGRSVVASTSTRAPPSSTASARARAAGQPGASPAIVSMPPRTQVPCPSKWTPLQPRSEAKGTCDTAAQAGGAGIASAITAGMPLSSGSTAAIAASTGSKPSRGDSGSIAWNSARPSVMVPVLSMQSTSTRLSPSMASSSSVTTPRRVSRSAATVKAIEVSSTSPSGTSVTSPATDVRRRPGTTSSACRWPTRSTTAATGMDQAMVAIRRLIPVRSSERASRNRRASLVSWLA